VSGLRQQCMRFVAAATGSLEKALVGLLLAGLLEKGALAVLMLVCASQANAHATSTSYLVARDNNGDVSVTWDVAVADVHWAVGLDDDGDGRITWREIESHRGDIGTLANDHLQIGRARYACLTRLTDVLIADHASEPHVSLVFHARCARALAGALRISATLFFDKDSTQRTLMDVSTPAGSFTSVLSPETPVWVQPAAPSMLRTFATFLGQGLWHVWIGYDHLAFLFLLLLPAVLRGETAFDLLRVITAFTLAHSITLVLAATETVHVPVRPVEIAIALSIVVAGFLNLFPSAARVRLALAFGFGLIHGFGFANALAELGAHGARLVPTLAGFNIGVELAQIALVAAVLPLLLRARRSVFYAGRFMPAASLAAAMAGAAWLAERVG
jgi:HupE / UreJ protein